MEKLLMSRLPVWLVLVLAIFGMIGTLFYGVLLDDHYRGEGVFGQTSKRSAIIAGAPRQVFGELAGPDLMAVAGRHLNRFDGQSGWFRSDGSLEPIEGHLLLSRYDGDARRHVVELVDLASYQVVHQWAPDASSLLDQIRETEVLDEDPNWRTDRFRYIHPFALPDGSLVIKDHDSPLFRVNPCGEMMWFNTNDIYHHSTEIDADGNLWVPARIAPTDLPVGNLFRDDGAIKLSQDGDVLEQHSLVQAFLDGGLQHHILTAENFHSDPIHLNDIQPVLSDGPHWKKGDVFVSMRTKSIVALFRPSTGTYVWLKKGPWMGQHDVDILDEHRIAVYSNNAMAWSGEPFVNGYNSVMIYDFETGEISQPFRATMEAQEVATEFEGLSEHIAGGRLMIEEENAGRLLFISQDRVLAEFVNRASDGVKYRLGWSRYIDPAQGAALASTLSGANCPE